MNQKYQEEARKIVEDLGRDESISLGSAKATLYNRISKALQKAADGENEEAAELGRRVALDCGSPNIAAERIYEAIRARRKRNEG